MSVLSVNTIMNEMCIIPSLKVSRDVSKCSKQITAVDEFAKRVIQSNY